MRHLRAATLLALTLAGAAPALAHPHIFIDTGIEAIFDEAGKVSALRITWRYDEFYSLLILQDRGLDSDYDGVLSPEEEQDLSGFDMRWDADFAGDTYVLHGESPVDLGRPEETGARFEGGMIVSTHLRRLAEPLDVTHVPLVVQAYDPGYYSAYAITLPTGITGREDCEAEVYEPDRDAASDALAAVLAELTPDQNAELIGFPAVGAEFADEVRLICAVR